MRQIHVLGGEPLAAGTSQMSDRLSIPASAVGREWAPPLLKKRDLFAGASREFRLVAQCCCPPCLPVRASSLQMLADGVRWNRVLHLAKRHRVMGLVHTALGPVEEVPDAVRVALARGAGAIAMANMNALSALAEIRCAFASEAVPFVLLKGLHVGQVAYGSVVSRHSKDVDLLVEPEFVDRACDALVAIGFARAAASSRVSAGDEPRWRRFRKHHDFVNAHTGVHVEVHWRRADNVHFAGPQAEPSRMIEVGGLELPVPSEMDLLLDLCLHGASHAWFRLKWIADVAALLAKAPGDAGARLLGLAKLHDVDRPVEQALLLCSALYPGLEQARVPAATRTGVWLARIAAEALLTETTKSASSEADFVATGLKRSRLMLRRSWHYRLEELRVQAASPADWEMMPVPGRLQFLHLMLRLPLWLKRRWLSRRVAIMESKS